jgi:membrane peptidoglycan carboxypeptidase
VGETAPATETRMQLGASVSSVEVGTGRILIMAQNKTFDDTGAGDATTTAVNFNGDITHGGSKGFQPGSTYKPYVLLAFLASGHGLNETFNASIRATPMAKFQDSCNGPYGGPDYTYRNDSGEGGLYNVVRGTAGSVNSVFIQMGAEVDQCDVAKLAASIGVHRAEGKPDGSDLFTNPACLVGGCLNNIAPLTQATAYAAIANQGTYCKPIIIDKFIADSGSEIAGQDAECSPSLVTPAVANTAAYAMEAVMGGTGSSSNPRDGTPYIGKTGTTNDAIHTWMVGSSTRVATAVWAGNIDGKQSMRRISIAGRSGGMIRHATFKPIAQAIDAQYPGGAFPGPDPALMKGVQVFVPDGLIGTTPEVAKAAIEQAQLSYEDGGQMDSDLPVGTVVATDPAGGSQVSKGSVVRVYTSNGQATAVPDVVSSNQSYNDAKNQLESAGFTNVTQTCEVFDPTPPANHSPGTLNNVVAQNPAGGSVVNKNNQITLTVRKNSCP